MHYPFISYSRIDQSFALKLASDLQKREIDFWFDQYDIPTGALWDTEIEKALKKSDALIVIISDNAVRSKNVLDEISYAIEENKLIIPVKISDCDIPLRIRRHQYIDFKGNYKKGFQVLLDVLEKNHNANFPSIDKSTNQTTEKIGKRNLFKYGIFVLLTGILLFAISKQFIVDTIAKKENAKEDAKKVRLLQLKDAPTSVSKSDNNKEKPMVAEKIPVENNTKVQTNLPTEKKLNGYVTKKKAPYSDEWYTGQIKNGEYHGIGKLFNPDGTLIYDGEFSQGYREGLGKAYVNNKICYSGEWAHNLRNGHGTQYQKKYLLRGEWYNGYFRGKEIIFDDNTKYFGDADDYFYQSTNGKARIEFANGDIYEGNFKDCQMNGYGTYTWKTGGVYKGQFKLNKINGEGTFLYTNGTKNEGIYTSISNGRVNFDENGTKKHFTIHGIILQIPPVINRDFM